MIHIQKSSTRRYMYARTKGRLGHCTFDRVLQVHLLPLYFYLFYLVNIITKMKLWSLRSAYNNYEIIVVTA